MFRVFSCKRNPRQITAVRLSAALETNKRLAKYFSYKYYIPDYSELESVGLIAIAEICKDVRKTRQHKSFQSHCRKRITSRIVDYLRKCDKENDGKLRAIMVLRHYTDNIVESTEQETD